MDVRQYFKPVDFSVFSQKGNMWKYSLGQKIEKSTAKITVDNVQSLDVALIGVPFENGVFNEKNRNVPDKIRSELYQLTGFQTKKNILHF